MNNLQKQEDLIFSLRAAERILFGCTNYSVNDLYLNRATQEVAILVARASQLKIVPAQHFYDDFTAVRQASSTALKLEQQSANSFRVINSSKGSSYTVEAKDDTIVCQCQDYTKQTAAFGQGCCKHGYRVLKHLGYETLSQYKEQSSQRAEAA